jgi:hypothetical protein
MTEQELRMLVRQAIARAQGGSGGGAAPSHLAPSDAPSHLRTFAPSHPSHGLLLVSDGSDADGPCIIEPAVSCNHCGYCKSLGH